MKVLFVSHHSGLGGAERSLLDLLRALEGRSVRRDLVCPEGPLADRARALDVRVWNLELRRLAGTTPLPQALGLLPSMASITWQLVKILRARDIELVHANSTQAQAWAWPALRLTRRPYVWHWRDFYGHPRLHGWLARGRGVSLAISDAVADHARSQLPSSARVVRVYNGLTEPSGDEQSASHEADAWRHWLERGPAGPVFVAAGQAVARKGYIDLIDAFARLRSKTPSARLVLATQCPDDDALAHEAELRARIATAGGKDHVLLTGELTSLDELLAAADCVVVPSRREPFGRVAVEAMLARRAVIASAVDGLCEIVKHGETGLLVPPGDVAALAAAMEQLAGDPERRRSFGREGDARARTLFSPEVMARGVAREYERLLHA